VSSADGTPDESSRELGDLVDLITDVPDAPYTLRGFARSYVRRLSSDYVASHDPSQLAAHVRSLHDFAFAADPHEVAIRVFHPTLGEDGYRTDGAVVEIATRDMAFLVDSVSNEIQAHDAVVHHVFHPVVGLSLDAEGDVDDVVAVRDADLLRSVEHFELDRRLDPGEVEEIEAGLRGVLADVDRAVSAFGHMQAAVSRMIDLCRAGSARYGAAEIDEATDFLTWLLDLNFVFLGYREYKIEELPEGRCVSVEPGSGLGILSEEGSSGYSTPVLMEDLEPALRARYESGFLVVITKTNSLSRVHRRAKMDYIGVRIVDEGGSVVGEGRLLGLFTSKAYMTAASTIPILAGKLEQIVATDDVVPGSHYHKQIVQLFNSFPKDELFSTPVEDIHKSILALVELQEREQVRLIVRRDLLSRNVSLLVVLPRDRFDADLRKRLQEFFRERFGGAAIDYQLSLGETDTARIHFTVWIEEGDVPEVSFTGLEEEVVAMTRTWEEHVVDLLVEQHGHERGHELGRQWAWRFPDYFRSSVSLEMAAEAIVRVDQLAVTGGPVVGLINDDSNGEPMTRLVVYLAGGRLELSELMPTLEDFGLRVVEEVPTRLLGEDDVFIHDFGVLDREELPLRLDDSAERLAATVCAVLQGDASSDSLNRLIISTDLDYHQVQILRAYRVYWRRVSPAFTDGYINDAFAAHPALAEELVRFFSARFDPESHADAAASADAIRVALDGVSSLDEDRILRGFLSLMLATLRTSAYQEGKDSLAFKLASSAVPDMPQPAPLFEIFVFSREVEGIHLRGGRVARGGIRWSTRKEDYRTEVLGLMKAQMTKNAVIVPTGSKGGFVMREAFVDSGDVAADVKRAYSVFIRGLLDVTDNLVAGEIVPPPDVKVYDEPDSYLVVAADKGTAQLSDTANQLAAEYGFWLGDAFASGGSAGYDHKVLGITARGAWESVKWHFRELGLDAANDTIRVVGIGDMSGDVFGNGMLLSENLQVVAAFDHRHIFIDPDPDTAASFAERQRLFDLPRSSWEDYDPGVISDGGGVYPRQAKRIDLSPEAREALGTSETALTPNGVIRTILQAPVDLLWNGGIGTYVKASTEPNGGVGDRGNDAVRVDANTMRVRVIGEGGNLGLTQLARIQYARNGGRVNTDFFDNSGGVHCSDREVNLKVLLGLAEDADELTRAGRNELVAAVAFDVVDRILYDNFLQAQILSQETAVSSRRLESYEDLMVMLETEGLLDREIEQLPSTDELNERARVGGGLESPELAVLLAYAKRSLSEWLLESSLPDDDAFELDLLEYFPSEVVKRFGDLIPEHPLRRDLIATIVANEVVNSEGITFVSRLMEETGAGPADIVRAYRIAREVAGAAERWRAVEALVGSVAPDVERELLSDVDVLVESIASWHLAHPSHESMVDVVAATRPAFEELAGVIADAGPPQWRTERLAAVAGWVDQGVPEVIAARHVYQEELIHGPDIIDVALTSGRSVEDVARVFFLAGAAFEIDWLEEQVDSLPGATRWHRRAIQTVSDDLVLLRRQIAERILEASPDADPAHALDTYLISRTHEIGRLTRFMRALAVDGVDDVASVVVAIRRIRTLVGR